MKHTVGSVAKKSIAEGKSNKEVLVDVYQSVEGAKTNLSTINWYRTQMRKEDSRIRTAREIRKYREEMKLPAEGDEVEKLYEIGVLKRNGDIQ